MNEELLEKLKYEVSAGEYSTIKTKDLETLLNYIKILETATNNRYPYVIGGRTLYSRLQQVNKEYLIKDYLRLRNETEQLIKEKENSISKEVIEKKIEELDKEYNEILSDYGNIDTDIVFNITNQNVRKHCDEIVEKIIILKELLEVK